MSPAIQYQKFLIDARNSKLMTGGKIFLRVVTAKRKRGIWIFPDWGKKQEIYQKN